jgi:hypothetical protein
MKSFEIEAGPAARNQAQEIANAQRLYPLLIQLPGIDPEFQRCTSSSDDRLTTEAFKSALPSIVAMNGMAQGGPPPGPTMPGAGAGPGAMQGPQGAVNGPPPEGGGPPPGGPPDAAGQLGGVPPGRPHPMPG